MRSAEAVVWEAMARAFAPPPSYTISEYAEKFRRLPRISSYQHGFWRTPPYLRQIQDLLGVDSLFQIFVIKKPVQSGATDGPFINWLLWQIEHDPSSISVYYPTVKTSRRFSRVRLAPAIQSIEALMRLLPARAKDGSNTTLHKEYPGGV